jgi:uncharacterized protein YndB with AHSA1/START domain
MEQPSVTHNTFVIERSYHATPERVFNAFADPAKKRRWFVEGERHDVEQYELDFRVGGQEKARLRFREGSPIAGLVLTNDTSYQDILREKCVSVSLVTIELLPSATGTDLICTHQGAFFEGGDGPEMRQEGWRKLLDRLTAEFPG